MLRTGLLRRLVYLTLGLAVILVFIGVKLILVFVHEDVSAAIPSIPTAVSPDRRGGRPSRVNWSSGSGDRAG